YPQVVWLPAPTVPGCRGEAVATDALWSSNLNLRGAHMRQFVALVAVAIAVGLPSVTLYAQDTKYSNSARSGNDTQLVAVRLSDGHFRHTLFSGHSLHLSNAGEAGHGDGEPPRLFRWWQRGAHAAARSRFWPCVEGHA